MFKYFKIQFILKHEVFYFIFYFNSTFASQEKVIIKIKYYPAYKLAPFRGLISTPETDNLAV